MHTNEVGSCWPTPLFHEVQFVINLGHVFLPLKRTPLSLGLSSLCLSCSQPAELHLIWELPLPTCQPAQRPFPPKLDRGSERWMDCGCGSKPKIDLAMRQRAQEASIGGRKLTVSVVSFHSNPNESNAFINHKKFEFCSQMAACPQHAVSIVLLFSDASAAGN